MKKGKMLESFVAYVYSNLLEFSNCNTIVSQNVFIKGLSGISHEFDVYYEFPHLNMRFQVAIECKDWKHRVDKGEVQKFSSKIEDLSNIAGVMIATNGYQKGALEFAKHKGILLLTIQDLPTLTDIVAKKLEFLLLPSEEEIGVPFWTLMHVEDNDLTGNYFNIGTKEKVIIPLFFSKEIAKFARNQIMDKENWCVRGLSQNQLNFLVQMAKNISHHTFGLCFTPIIIEEQMQYIELKYDDIEKYYLL